MGRRAEEMSRQELGDWQTPPLLAEAVLKLLQGMRFEPAVLVEPTCGRGSFLIAGADVFPEAELRGYELNESYLEEARGRVDGARGRLRLADFFEVSWETEFEEMPEPILVVGNPPWVTSSRLGSLGSRNLPEKANFKGLSGYEALTGKSNFDVSEWMILRMLQALRGRRAALAVLCKSTVVRRVLEFAVEARIPITPGGIWRIDAMQHFDAAVDAVLFVCRLGREPGQRWPVFAGLDAGASSESFDLVGGKVVPDAECWARTSHLDGESHPEWRSGLKHDCARVMELTPSGDAWTNGLGESVAIERDFVFPLLKSSDVANGQLIPRRFVVVPQRALGEDTAALRVVAPKAWSYLSSHRDALRARKSSIYRRQADFAIFGVGPYSFSPWKVAVSGLYKKLHFSVVGPHEGQPVILDDTCYFLPFETEIQARRACSALCSPLALEYFKARVFWDAKRPIKKETLQKLDLEALLAEVEGASVVPRRRTQLALSL